MPVSARSLFSCALLAAALSTGGSAHARSDPLTASIEITPDNPGIHDILMLRLSIDVPADRLVNFPRLGNRLSGFAVTGQRALAADAEAGGDRAWVQQYRLEPEATGDLTIPPLTITVQDPETLEAIEVSTEEVIVHIASIVPPETDLRQIRDMLPPVGLPALDRGLPAWLLPAAFAIMPALLAFWWLGARKRAGKAESANRPAHMVAMEELEALRSTPVLDDAGVERFHIRLAAVLRRYLADGFRIAAPLRTTEELLAEAAFAKSPVKDERPLIEQPLDQCDRVKFARHRPSGDAMRRALEAVTAFVRQTSDRKLGDRDR